jgi:hypothetical protein
MNERKTLLPELLPAPRPHEGPTPPERVAARARLFLERFRGVRNAAGAALISLHCSGYQVVDPLPPPASQCRDFTSFPLPNVDATLGRVAGKGTALFLDLTNAHEDLFVETVRVKGARVERIDGLSTDDGGRGFRIILLPSMPSGTLLVEVDLTCAPLAATQRYELTYDTTAVHPKVRVTALD